MSTQPSLSNALQALVQKYVPEQRQQEEWCKSLKAAIDADKLYIFVEDQAEFLTADEPLSQMANLTQPITKVGAVVLSANKDSRFARITEPGKSTIVWTATLVTYSVKTTRELRSERSLAMTGNVQQCVLLRLAHAMLCPLALTPKNPLENKFYLIFRTGLKRSKSTVLSPYVNTVKQMVLPMIKPLELPNPEAKVTEGSAATAALRTWLKENETQLGTTVAQDLQLKKGKNFQDDQTVNLNALLDALSSKKLFVMFSHRWADKIRKVGGALKPCRAFVLAPVVNGPYWKLHVTLLYDTKEGDRIYRENVSDIATVEFGIPKPAEQCILFSFMRASLCPNRISKLATGIDSPVLFAEGYSGDKQRTGAVYELVGKIWSFNNVCASPKTSAASSSRRFSKTAIPPTAGATRPSMPGMPSGQRSAARGEGFHHPKKSDVNGTAKRRRPSTDNNSSDIPEARRAGLATTIIGHEAKRLASDSTGMKEARRPDTNSTEAIFRGKLQGKQRLSLFDEQEKNFTQISLSPIHVSGELYKSLREATLNMEVYIVIEDGRAARNSQMNTRRISSREHLLIEPPAVALYASKGVQTKPGATSSTVEWSAIKIIRRVTTLDDFENTSKTIKLHSEDSALKQLLHRQAYSILIRSLHVADRRLMHGQYLVFLDGISSSMLVQLWAQFLSATEHMIAISTTPLSVGLPTAPTNGQQTFPHGMREHCINALVAWMGAQHASLGYTEPATVTSMSELATGLMSHKLLILHREPTNWYSGLQSCAELKLEERYVLCRNAVGLWSAYKVSLIIKEGRQHIEDIRIAQRISLGVKKVSEQYLLVSLMRALLSTMDVPGSANGCDSPVLLSLTMTAEERLRAVRELCEQIWKWRYRSD